MKEKTKKFFIEKKELLIFIGVVVFVFVAVIGIASLALNSSNGKEDVLPPTNQDQPDNPANSDEPSNPEPVVADKFSLPLTGDYKLVRTYFDEELPVEELVSAVINSDNGMITSSGTSFAKADNSTFEVLAIYDGKVINVVMDELVGATIEIQHSNKVISVYSSLAEVKVKVGDVIEQGTVIAKASTSIMDTEAGVHVHLEVKANDKYVNPTSIFGKEIEEVVEMK